MDSELKYDLQRVDSISKLDDERKKVLEWVGSNKKVLEIGCHSGVLSYWLKKQDCDVTGVEIDAKAIDKAKPFLTKAIAGNIEDEAVWEELGNAKFDVIVIMHVLEHLVDPWVILKKTHKLLSKGGEVIIGLPNINNILSRYNILMGDFDYTETGIMDKTHLRFFNIKTAKELIESADYKELEYFSPWRKGLFNHIRFLWRFSKFGLWLINKYPNLTDLVMMFRVMPK